MLNPVASLFAEYSECALHRAIVLGLSCCIQNIGMILRKMDSAGMLIYDLRMCESSEEGMNILLLEKPTLTFLIYI